MLKYFLLVIINCFIILQLLILSSKAYLVIAEVIARFIVNVLLLLLMWGARKEHPRVKLP